MKIIINTSNIVGGGGIQVSLSILNELKKLKKNSYHIFLTSRLSTQINRSEFPDNFTFHDVKGSPSNLRTRKRRCKEFELLETVIQPNLVFSVFGPSYWKPKATHISGFADGWCYNPDTIAYGELNFFEKIKTKLKIIYKNYFIKRDADYLIVETNVAKNNVKKYLGYNENKIFVVGNTYSNHFNEKASGYRKDPYTKLITISAYYKHKNLAIINEVTNLLRLKSEERFKFFLTIDKKNFIDIFGDNPDVINLGPQKVQNCPELYAKSDLLFLPTLLETFTASYPEAMKMETPILTSDLDFAKDLCGNAAVYFDPKNPSDIADKIIELSGNRNLYSQLIENGKERLKNYETPRTRAERYLNIFSEIINHQS